MIDELAENLLSLIGELDNMAAAQQEVAAAEELARRPFWHGYAEGERAGFALAATWIREAIEDEKLARAKHLRASA